MYETDEQRTAATFSLIESNKDILPLPGSYEEGIYFRKIQEQLKEQFEKAFPDPRAPKTVIILPSGSCKRNTRVIAPLSNFSISCGSSVIFPITPK